MDTISFVHACPLPLLRSLTQCCCLASWHCRLPVIDTLAGVRVHPKVMKGTLAQPALFLTSKNPRSLSSRGQFQAQQRVEARARGLGVCQGPAPGGCAQGV